jgi:hypothetical protein
VQNIKKQGENQELAKTELEIRETCGDGVGDEECEHQQQQSTLGRFVGQGVEELIGEGVVDFVGEGIGDFVGEGVADFVRDFVEK